MGVQETILRITSLWYHYQANKHEPGLRNLRFGQYLVNKLGLTQVPDIFYEGDDGKAYMKALKYVVGDSE